LRSSASQRWFSGISPVPGMAPSETSTKTTFFEFSMLCF
jgi:hypothetical protein